MNDAKAVEDFLKSDMGVREDRIRRLHNHAATRDAILKAFKQLSVEETIRVGDPILIYYAGHGGQLPPPENWEVGVPGRKIQAICPYNYGEEGIHVIPDRTIGLLLDLICEQKGNNIVRFLFL